MTPPLPSPKRSLHRRILFWSAAVAIVALSILIPWGGATPAGPRAQLSANQISLGTGAPSEMMRGNVVLQNSGGAPLEFQITASCTCTELTPRQGVVAPGEQRSISVALTLPDHFARNAKSATLHIATNDPAAAQLGCTISASCPPPIQLTPEVVDFGRVTLAEASRLERRLKLTPGVNMETLPGDLCVSSAPEWLEASLEWIAADTAELRIQANRVTHMGTAAGAIDLTFGDGVTVSTPVRIEVADPVVAVPSTVVLRRRSSEHPPTAELIVVAVNRDLPLDAAKAIDVPPGLLVEDLGRLGERRRRIRVTLKDGAKVPKHNNLELAFDGLAPVQFAVVLPD